MRIIEKKPNKIQDYFCDAEDCIKIRSIDISDNHLTFSGKWKEFFDFPIPDKIISFPGLWIHEYIIDTEIPNQCVFVHINGIRDFNSSFFMRGGFSVKYKKSWFQHLRFTIYDDFSVEFFIRNIDYSKSDSNPWNVLNLLDKLNFVLKFKKCLEQLSKHLI